MSLGKSQNFNYLLKSQKRTPVNCILSMLDMVKDQIPKQIALDFVDPAVNSGK